MKDREYSMDKGKSKHQEEDEDSGKKSPFYSRDICGGSMMENQGLGNEKQGIKPALQDSKRPKDLDLGYEILVETTVSDPPPHENSREYSIDKGKGKQQKDSAEFPTQPYNKLRMKFPAQIITEKGYDLLKRLLCLDPQKRLRVEQALNHGWFQEVPLPKSQAFMPTYPPTH